MAKFERWAQTERLFRASLARDPGERSTFLREACAADEELRLEVEALLAEATRDDASVPAAEPRSFAFRTVALALSPLVAALFLVTAGAVVRYGDRTREFGWTAVQDRGVFVVQRADAGGPAAGRLRPGDVIVAFDGDPRADRLDPSDFQRFVPASGAYSLTIRRDGAEQPVALTARIGTSTEQLRLGESLLVSAIVWFVVATLVAVYRPEQSVSRSAYAAGIAVGLYMLSQTRVFTLPWLPGPWRAAVLLVFPFSPMHLAVGYDFYVRFPAGISTTRPWRALRAGIYGVCALLSLEGSLLDTGLLLAGRDAFLDVRYRLAPIDRWLSYVELLIFPIAGLAIIAVVARNYRALQAAQDRRRLRWVLWGTVAGMTPFVAIELVRVFVVTALGVPVNLSPWIIPGNLATAAIPISFGYAIIKHRVFDITFVVRRGLQYLLARNALRGLLLLPVAALAYGVIVHRDQPIGQLLLINSVYVYLIGAAVVSLRFRTELMRWLDRRFFREAYDRERILLKLIQDVEKLDSASSVSKLVSHELETAFHPRSLFVWYREGEKPNLTLSYSSGGYLHSVELGPASPLVRLAELESAVIELPLAAVDDVPPADRAWLDEAGIRLIVPIVGSDRRLLGLLMLGDKKSEEPYSADDLKLLEAIARQIAVARENVRLKERVDQGRRLGRDGLADLETGHVSMLRQCPSCGACYDGSVISCASDGEELQLAIPVERTIEGKYRLDRLIGRGGMGAVYEATDLRLARRVAVKIMLGRAFGDQRALRRFEREAQASARLTHPNIVTVFDFGAVGADGAFLVMELVGGRTLRAELERRGSVSPAVAAAWFEQIGAAVAAAHRQGIVHRDLKPENVLVTTAADGGDLLKVLDFGLAKITAADLGDSGGLTNPGVVMGTAGYMAPEQLTAGEIDERADIFALGVMVAEAVTGRRPFHGRTHNEILLAILHEPFTLDTDRPELGRLESVLRRAVAKDPNGRYASVAAFVRDLLAALHAASSADPAR